MSNPCCAAMIYKSDGTAKRKTVGEPDFCGAGCVMVGLIRVPFPDCSIHGNRFTIVSKHGTMEA